MPEALLLAAAFMCNALGLAWLALAMQAHWQQVAGQRALPARSAVTLRVLGTAALVLSLALCLLADHASMAALVWIMALAAAALLVAFTLAWRPRTFAPLVACMAIAESPEL
ncbi:MAG: DUF3325 family protein [Gammaproteobacteria bacterium]